MRRNCSAARHYASLVVGIVQMCALQNVTRNLYKNVRFGTIGLALVLAIAASVWVKIFNLGTFISLLISGLLYFAVYYIVLLVKGEAIAREIFEQGKRLLHR